MSAACRAPAEPQDRPDARRRPAFAHFHPASQFVGRPPRGARCDRSVRIASAPVRLRRVALSPRASAATPSAPSSPEHDTVSVPPHRKSPSNTPARALPPHKRLWRTLQRASENVNHVLELTRPGIPFSQARYDALPTAVKTPAQMLGRMSPGCEGTHGVFPRCNFGCTPCYHSEDANRVRVDGMHTVTEVARQMQQLTTERGPVGHCQLIGGEVSLLSPEDHAQALQVMRFYGRIPMSFTHGDFDYDYLVRLAVRPEDGKRRFDRIDFAVHFDMFMYGRRGVEKPTSENDLAPYRRKFVAMFQRLKKEYGVDYYLAHNMTVQDGNLSQVADVVRDIKNLGFRMMSFQPAAMQGSAVRWRKSGFENVARNHGEDVWKQVEKGAGTRLPYSLFQMGDVRCNRTCAVAVIGPRTNSNVQSSDITDHETKRVNPTLVVPYFDDQCPADVKFRDIIVNNLGNIVLKPWILRLKVLRVLLTRIWVLPFLIAWAIRFVRRCGGILPILRYRVWTVTFVMHRFMDAANVQRAWTLMESGVRADDPQAAQHGDDVRETIERLSACSYGMAQVDQARVVPACVQHSVYDPDENKHLAQELKLSEPAMPANMADLQL